ncbi:MAG TPA: sugar ABC transporter permease [Bacillales bacterium]|nr:sugar ABC transporter permease [Bacillales bacterium]
MQVRKKIFPYLLIFPLAFVMISLVFYPGFVTLIDSFKSLNLTKPADVKFVGLSNYINLLQDPVVLRAAGNTALYYILAIVGEFLGGLFIALTLRNKFRGRGIVLALVILPWALPPVVNGVIWKWIYDPSYGVLNDLLLHAGLIDSYQVLLGQPGLAIFLVAIVHIWKMIPIVAVILLAALTTIPDDIYEAAEIDGANRWQRFQRITLPMLKPAIAIALTQMTFMAVNLFDEIFVLTGTALDTRSILIQTYLIAFRQLDLGLGMALSLLITIATLAISVLYIWLLRERRAKT